MTRLISVFAAAAVTAAAAWTATPAQADKLIQIVIDDSGVLHDEQDPQNKKTLGQFVGKFLNGIARDHRRDRGDTNVIVISAVAPAHILWSGDAAAFYRDGIKSPPLQATISDPPNGCNNLPEALAEVAANLRTMPPANENILHIITSGVHSGPNCAGLTQEKYIKLVETLDPTFAHALKTTAGQFGTTTVHFLTATQRRALLDALGTQTTGIILRAQGQN